VDARDKRGHDRGGTSVGWAETTRLANVIFRKPLKHWDRATVMAAPRSPIPPCSAASRPSSHRRIREAIERQTDIFRKSGLGISVLRLQSLPIAFRCSIETLLGAVAHAAVFAVRGRHLRRLTIGVAPFFEPSFRLSGDPILGFALGLEPADVLLLAAWMGGDHIPFVPQLDRLRDGRRFPIQHCAAPSRARLAIHQRP